MDKNVIDYATPDPSTRRGPWVWLGVVAAGMLLLFFLLFFGTSTRTVPVVIPTPVGAPANNPPAATPGNR